VPDPSVSHQVTLLYCDGTNQVPNISMSLLAPDGTTVATGAAVADPGAERACLQLTFSNLSEGELVVITTADYLPMGDYFMLFE